MEKTEPKIIIGMGEAGKTFILSSGGSDNLLLFEEEAWEKEIAFLNELPVTSRAARTFARRIMGDALEVEVEPDGSIEIPLFLWDKYLGTGSDRSICVLERQVFVEDGGTDHSISKHAKYVIVSRGVSDDRKDKK